MLVTDADNADRFDAALVERRARPRRPRCSPARRPSFETVDTAADDPAQLYYTSGTTGLAKGILHAHRYLLAHEEFVYCHDVQDGELFHGMGEWAWAAGIAPLLGPWRLGAVAVRLPARGRLRPGPAARRALRARGHERLHDADRDAGDDGHRGRRHALPAAVPASSARAGEPLNPEAIRWFREQYGLTVLDYYGLTESYPLCANYPFMEVREGSMGKPMPGWDVQILDEDEQPVERGRARRDLPARALEPALPARLLEATRGDARRPSAASGSTPRTPREQDEDGYFWYAGRADDVIISAGYRIGPFEVESACIEHAGGARGRGGRLAGRAARGNVVKAFVVLAEGHEPSDELAERRSRPSSASTSPPTPTRARSSSSTTCRRPSPARSAGSSCASARREEARAAGRVSARDVKRAVSKGLTVRPGQPGRPRAHRAGALPVGVVPAGDHRTAQRPAAPHARRRRPARTRVLGRHGARLGLGLRQERAGRPPGPGQAGRTWLSGTATILPDDDAAARLRWLHRPVNDAAVRALGTEQLVLRIDLDA